MNIKIFIFLAILIFFLKIFATDSLESYQTKRGTIIIKNNSNNFFLIKIFLSEFKGINVDNNNNKIYCLFLT